MTKLNYIICLIIGLAFVSCKQPLFLKRRYTNGFYFWRTGSVDLKNIQELECDKNMALIMKTSVAPPDKTISDTLVLTNGKKIPCKVKTVEQKQITYNSHGITKIVRNKDVAVINYEGNQKEYIFKHHPSENPLLQIGLFKPEARPYAGMAVFGYIIALIIGALLIPVFPVFGVTFFLLHTSLLIAHELVSCQSFYYKFLNLIGRFYSWLTVISFGLLVALILIVIIAVL